MLGNLFDVPNFEYTSTEDIRVELQTLVEATNFKQEASYYPETLIGEADTFQRISEWPHYRVDNVVRRSEALQAPVPSCLTGWRGFRIISHVCR